MDNEELIAKLTSGYRLPKPELCSDEVYIMIRSCWEYTPSRRPVREGIESHHLKLNLDLVRILPIWWWGSRRSCVKQNSSTATTDQV